MSIRVTTLEEPVIEKNVTVMADESLGGCASDYIERFEYKKATMEDCQTAHCGRCKPHFDFGDNTFPIVPYRHLPQTLIGMTADCRSLV